MNTGLDRHFRDCHINREMWENFALHKLSEAECVPLEEHLLICSACQDILAEIDEYIEVIKAAAALLEPGKAENPVTDSRTRRQIAKGSARATSA